jgi:hypothetical protein
LTGKIKNHVWLVDKEKQAMMKHWRIAFIAILLVALILMNNAKTGYTAAKHNPWFYVQATQIFGTKSPVDGAAVNFGQYQPWVDPNDTGGDPNNATHSVTEVMVTNGVPDGYSGPATTGMIEFGWIVDPTDYHDMLPHLIIEVRYVDPSRHEHACVINLNGSSCDFQPIQGANIQPGDPVQIDTSGDYEIKHYQGNWWIAYDNQWIGTFPDSHWFNTFRQVLTTQWYGEVYTASNSAKPCTDMGNGKFGSKNGSATVYHMQYIKVTPNGQTFQYEAAAKLYVTDSHFYDAGNFVPSKSGFYSFTYGGPGAC